jgi:cytochrome c oxidase subunit 2
MKIVTSVLKSLVLVTALFSFSLTAAFAQSAEEGEKLYNANCTSCHAINEKVVGPALKNVHTKRKEAWLIKWIKNSQALIKSGDAEAAAVYKENNESVMTSFENLSDNEIKSVIAYIKKASEAPAQAAVVPTGTSTDVSVTATTTSEVSNTLKTSINWLIIIILVLLVMVIVLVLDILVKVGEIQGKKVINWNGINAKLMLAFGAIGIVASAWEIWEHGKLTVFNQTPASTHGAEYDNMFMITLIITGIVFFITQGLLFWYAYKYKHSSKRRALFYPDNHKIELIWTVIPAIVLTILVVRGLKTWTDMTGEKDPSSRVIEVYGFQFAWNARYAGEDNLLGKHDFRQIGVINALGVDTNDAKAQDDIITNELHLAVGEPVMLKFRAKDVIHSAYLPHFRVQMNVVPGLPTQFGFTPSLTTAEMRQQLNDPKFDYAILCNKICGSAHYRMKMKVVVHTKEEFKKWLAQQPRLVNKSTPAAQATAQVETSTETKAAN